MKEEYQKYYNKLKKLIAKGQGDSVKAEQMRDKMDVLWLKMTKNDRISFNNQFQQGT